MASFIYFYAKFTEEFLLLSAAAIFALLAVYCYTWVVKKRRLGAARDQVPAGMVKVYLNQLINEAQFVRTQLFGLAGGVPPNADHFAAHFSNPQASGGVSAGTGHPTSDATGAPIPNDLLERLKALENQLADKESMVVNINVEKSKLLEEVENLKQNEKAMGSAATGNNEDLIQKIKALEERLEEYALFEDDLANLKRLQQENASLKKQIDQAPQMGAMGSPPQGRAEPAVPAQMEPAQRESLLDQKAIDALLDGASATPHTEPTETPEEIAAKQAAEAAQKAGKNPAEPIEISAKAAAEKAAQQAAKEREIAEKIAQAATTQAAKDKADAEEAAVAARTAAAKANPSGTPASPSGKKGDEFENLVDSVEDSLSAKAPGAAAQAAKSKDAKEQAAMAAPEQASSSAEKSDEELLKEFENLLNS